MFSGFVPASRLMHYLKNCVVFNVNFVKCEEAKACLSLGWRCNRLLLLHEAFHLLGKLLS